LAFHSNYVRILYRFLSPVHTSDNVAKNGDIVAETGNIVAKHTMLTVLATMSPVSATILNEISSLRQCRNKLNVFNLLRHCRKDEISFDIVAKNGNIVFFGDNVAVFGDIVAGVDGALDIARYWSKIAASNLSHLYLAPPLG